MRPHKFFVLADGESGMEEETRSVSGFLHFDTVSKGLCHLGTHLNQLFLAKYNINTGNSFKLSFKGVALLKSHQIGSAFYSHLVPI